MTDALGLESATKPAWQSQRKELLSDFAVGVSVHNSQLVAFSQAISFIICEFPSFIVKEVQNCGVFHAIVGGCDVVGVRCDRPKKSIKLQACSHCTDLPTSALDEGARQTH